MTTGTTALAGLRLTPRDESLLTDLYRHGAMLRSQIQVLHFPGSGLRRLNRRLQVLASARLLVGAPLPLGPLSTLTPGNSAGSFGQWSYRLAGSGAAVVAAHLGIDAKEVRRHVRQGSPTALAHTLEIVQARVTLTLRERASEGEFALLAYEPEVCHAWRVRPEGSDVQGRLETFRPDAHVHFIHEGAEMHVFIEIDLGHTSSEEWTKKREIASRFLSAGLYSRHYGDSPFLIWTLTTTKKRAENLRRGAEREGIGFYRFITLIEFASLTDSTTVLSLV